MQEVINSGESITTSAATVQGKISNMNVDTLAIGVEVGGTGHAFSDFEAHTLTVVLKNSRGNNISIIPGARVGDLLKLSDFLGGFSTVAKGDATGLYTFAVQLGNVKLVGDDILEVSYQAPGDGSATYLVRMFAYDLESGPERILGYESYTGSGLEIFERDVIAAYLMDAPSGNNISVSTEFEQYVANDYGVHVLAQSQGKLETEENIAPVFQDNTGYGQAARIKLPNGVDMLLMRAHFPTERLDVTQSDEAQRQQRVLSVMRSQNSEKYRYLQAIGVL
jgi:hypothetical protein